MTDTLNVNHIVQQNLEKIKQDRLNKIYLLDNAVPIIPIDAKVNVAPGSFVTTYSSAIVVTLKYLDLYSNQIKSLTFPAQCKLVHSFDYRFKEIY